MLLQFCLAYPSEHSAGRRWVFNPGRIARHYILSRWCVLDFFSIATSGFDIFGDDNDGQTSTLSGLRAIRALRLIKVRARGPVAMFLMPRCVHAQLGARASLLHDASLTPLTAGDGWEVRALYVR